MQPRLLSILLLFFTLDGRAESIKSHQVTGPVVALTDHIITIQNGDEKWEIARTAATKVDGKLVLGSRVTVYYKISADRIEVKDAGEKPPSSPTEKADRAAQKAAERAEKKAAK